MKVSEISYSTNQKKNIRNENYVDYNRGDNVYKVIDKFPYINNSISPVLRNFIASREKFYFGSILLENDTEIIFTERLQILANLKYSLYDNFQGLYLPPVDTYPNQVRSDLKKYLNNLNRGISIGRLEANYFFSFGKKNFFRLSAGIFEEMFGGYGFDYIFYPEGSNISLGLETFYVKKREYTLDLKFKDYSNYITRASIELSEPRTDINFKLSAGEYLAGDKGYTFEVSRRFENGVKFGAFFSRTDVSATEYGEGSFDKGIKLVIPFSIFGKGDSLTRYEWHPLTKDPAALLIKSTDLRTEVQRYRIY